MMDPVEPIGREEAEVLRQAVAAWRRAQVVHQTPSWEGQPEARAAAEKIALHGRFESPLLGLLANSNQLVVAYALIALELMGSDRLASLPETLLANRSNLTLQFGSIRNAMDLGGFARQVRKRARVKLADQGIRSAL